MLNAVGYFYFTWISACLKNLSYKPALNYLDISCPSLTSQAISQSVLSRLEFLGYYRSAMFLSVRLGQFFPRKVRVQSRYARRFLLFALLSSPDRAPAANSAWTHFSHALRADNSKQRSVWRWPSGWMTDWLYRRSHQCNAKALSWTADQNGSRILSARLWSCICINHRLSSQVRGVFSAVSIFWDLDCAQRLLEAVNVKLQTNQRNAYLC
jgi:hypothetical protein